jgi:hypothetical protein
MRADLGAGTTLYIRFDDVDMRITAGWSEVLELSDGFGNNVLQDMKKKTNTKTKKAVDISMPSCREFLLQPCDKEGVVVKELDKSDNGPLTQYVRQQLQQQQPASSLAPAEPVVTAATTNMAVAVDPATTSSQGQTTATTARAPPRDEPVVVAPVVVAPAVLPTPTSTAETTETDASPSQRKEQQPQPRRASIRKLPTGEQTESPHRKKPKPTDAAVSYIRLVCFMCVRAVSCVGRSVLLRMLYPSAISCLVLTVCIRASAFLDFH